MKRGSQTSRNNSPVKTSPDSKPAAKGELAEGELEQVSGGIIAVLRKAGGD